MKNNEKVTIATKVGEGADAVIPDDIKPLEFIQKVYKLLKEWGGQDDKRGFLLIATCDSQDKGCGSGLVSGCCGDYKVIAKMMCGVLENDKEFRKMMIDAFKLREQANQ
jgi:hypothetical protein